MRMPLLAYVAVVGTALLALLVLSSYELPDVGSPIKTSQLVGLPKMELRSDRNEPAVTASANFAAPEKESQAVQSLNGIHAQQISAKQKSAQTMKRRQAERDSASAGREHYVVYTHDFAMSIH